MQSTRSLRPRSTQSRTSPAWLRRAGLPLALLVALAIRVWLWDQIPRTGLVSDEGEYLSAANWLAHGRGFAWYLGYLWTRAPIYPLFVAAHLRLFGDTVIPIYITQTLLSLLNVALVYSLAQQIMRSTALASARSSVPNVQPFVPTLAALLMAVYFPFALYTQVLLSETLFITLLLGAFLALARWSDRDDHRPPTTDYRTWALQTLVTRHTWLIAAGALFGLATLTRSLTLLFIPIVAGWLAISKFHHRDTENTEPEEKKWISVLSVPLWSNSIVFLLAATLIILPWTAYNSLRLYGGFVAIDTSGAFNILLGGRTAYDGNRNDAATRDFALALLDQQLKPNERAQKLADQYDTHHVLLRAGACLYQQNDPALLAAITRPVSATSQAERQQLMSREGVCLIRAKPLAFIQKSLGELIDLFQINYGGDERFADGFTLGRLPRWYTLALFLLDDTLYVLVLPLAVIGWAIARKLQIADCRLQIANHPQSAIYNLQSAIGLWWLYNLAVAPLLFAINRFRLPLLPFAFIFAAYALAQLPRGWRALRSRYGALSALLAGLLFLIAATPYAYLEPRAPETDSRWASYLGPYPSSITDTWQAWWARPGYLREQQVMHALGRGDAALARKLLADSAVTSHTRALAQPLLAGLNNQPDAGLMVLANNQNELSPLEIALIKADLLRRKGDPAAARAILTQELVDNNNPVAWAWDWLHPAPLPGNRIDLAGNLDLGYINGCYLGEGDPPAGGNFRWCTDGAQMRFPAASTGAPQLLMLRADGRGWAGYAATPPPVRVFAGDRLAGTFTPSLLAPGEFSVTLPAAPAGTDVIVTLYTDTFIPGADRYLRQQGKAVVGQVQRLGVRLDWAALRGAAGIEN